MSSLYFSCCSLKLCPLIQSVAAQRKSLRTAQNLVANFFTHELCNVGIYQFHIPGWLSTATGNCRWDCKPRHSLYSLRAVPKPIWSSWSPFIPQLLVAFHYTLSLFPVIANHLHEEWSCLLSAYSPALPCKAGCPLSFGAERTAFTAHPSQETIIPHQESSCSPKWYCTALPQSHRAVQNTHYQPTSSPTPEIRKREHTWHFLLCASSSSLTQLCWGLSTSVSQYSSHWLNWTCFPVSQTNHKEP